MVARVNSESEVLGGLPGMSEEALVPGNPRVIELLGGQDAANVPVLASPDAMLGSFVSRRRRDDRSFRLKLEQSFSDDPTVSAAMMILETGNLDSGIATIIRNLLEEVFKVYELRKENTVLRSTVDDLRVMADVDGLTGLLNQRAFRAYGNRVFSHGNGGIACVMGDVDYFKRVNDRHGHAAGDRVLSSVGAVMGKIVRERDVVGRDGGEEFGVVLHGADLDGASVFAERLRKKIEAMTFEFGGDVCPVTMSFGVAVKDVSDGSFDELRRRADEGLYVAKNEHGRNAVVLSSVVGKGGLRCISSSNRFKYTDDGRGVSVVDSLIGRLRRIVTSI